ncbi:MAG TPA: hypothetical protein VKG25_29020 [Bryobacteraceae bacterium]|nr:hypothetical protein [Bryobacteraceae bacterium]
MNPSPSRHPSQFLILVNVNFMLGSPVYNYRAFGDGSNASKVVVAPGDQIGWFVRVQAGSGWSTPAYTLAFDNPSILGTESIAVPGGGPSGFFTVLAISGDTKYTLAVSGIVPADDPQIQVNPNGSFIIATPATTPVQYNVRWTVATNMMEIESGSQWIPFPPAGQNVAFGDTVQFFAVLTPPQDFEIDFPSNLNRQNVWGSPFSFEGSSFPATNSGSYESTDNLPVADRSDLGKDFIFVAALTDGTTQSGQFTLVLS